MQGEPDSPKAPLGNNFRPIQQLNHRFIRTNIDFRRTTVSSLIAMESFELQIEIQGESITSNDFSLLFFSPLVIGHHRVPNNEAQHALPR